MSILVAHIDGLFVEDSNDIPNTDPLLRGIEFFKRIVQHTAGGASTTLLTCDAAQKYTIEGWARSQDIPATWVLAMQNATPQERIANTLSFVGAHHDIISFYVSALAYDCSFLASEGIATVQFRHPQRVTDWGPEVGSTWRAVGVVEEALDE